MCVIHELFTNDFLVPVFTGPLGLLRKRIIRTRGDGESTVAKGPDTVCRTGRVTSKSFIQELPAFFYSIRFKFLSH